MTDTERGFLLTSMGDYAVAKVLRRSLAWVQRERAMLAGCEPPPIKTRPRRVLQCNGGHDSAQEAATAAPAPPVHVVPPKIARWAQWFLSARYDDGRPAWSVYEVAYLFDQPPGDLESLRC